MVRLDPATRSDLTDGSRPKIQTKRTGAKKGPGAATGGAGTRYENPVAARFLLDMLAGLNSLGPDFGRIARIDWQARDAGWLADDLALTCERSSDERRSVGIFVVACT